MLLLSYHLAKIPKIWIFLLCTVEKNSNFQKFCWVIRTQPLSVLNMFLLYQRRLWEVFWYSCNYTKKLEHPGWKILILNDSNFPPSEKKNLVSPLPLEQKKWSCCFLKTNWPMKWGWSKEANLNYSKIWRFHNECLSF